MTAQTPVTTIVKLTQQAYFVFAIELSLQHKHGIIIELCSIELSLQQAKYSFNRLQSYTI